MDGYLGEGRGVIGIDDLHARRKEFAHLLQLGFDRVGSGKGVGPGCLTDGHHRCWFAAALDDGVAALARQFRAAYVLDPHCRAVRVQAHRDVGKLLRRLQEVLDHDGRIEPLARQGGRTAELACRDLDIVGAQGGCHILKGQAVAGQLVRVDPDAH